MITKKRNLNRKRKKYNVDYEMQREPTHTLRTKVRQLKTNVVKSGRKLSDRFLLELGVLSDLCCAIILCKGGMCHGFAADTFISNDGFVRAG